MTEESVVIAVRHRLPVIGCGIACLLSDRPRIRLQPETEDQGDAATIVIADERTAFMLVDKCSNERRRPLVLIVTNDDREEDVRRALQAGIEGYLLSDCGIDELLEAIAALARGDRYFSRQVVGRIADSLTYEALTPRELDVLALLVEELNDKLIARDLGIAVATVKVHAKAVYSKLKASGRLQAVAVARARGMTLSVRPPAVLLNARSGWRETASAR